MGTFGELREGAGLVLDQRYRLERLLGSGGSSAVYAATDLKCGHKVAVKVAAAETSSTGYALFAAEGMTASRVNHPCAIAVYDIGRVGNRPYLVMELAPGVSLVSLLERSPLSPARAVTIAAQILGALTAAHHVGVIHCDLSSNNIIIDAGASADRVKVIDFGLAQSRTASRSQRVVGTVEYLAPEQLLREEISAATDLYAVGILLFEMIAGRTPFAGGSPDDTARRQLHETPPRLDTFIPACPPRLAELVAAALAKNPADRPTSAAAMRRQLLAATAHMAEASPTPPTLPTNDRLIGRDQALATILELLRRGRGALAVAGPEGSGRKRLLAEAARAVAPDVRLIVVKPPMLSRGESWAATLDLVRAVLDLDVPTIAKLRSAVAQIGLPERDVPGLADLLGLGEARDFDRNLRVEEAKASIRRVLVATSHRAPRVAVAFADVERLDEPSRRLALDLAIHAERNGIAVLLTGVGIAPEICPAIALAPLTPDVSEQIVASWLTTRERHLVPRADGLPAQLEQIAGWALDGHDIAECPNDLVEIIAGRIHRIDADTRILLQTLACFGGRLNHRLLRALQLRSKNAGLFALVNDVDDGLALHSATVARVVDATTPAGIRRELHGRALDILGDSATPATRAAHALGADELELAYSMFLQAGLDAFSRYDNHGASEHHLQAIRVARRMTTSAGASRSVRLARAAIFAAEALIDDGRAGPALDVLDAVDETTLDGAILASLHRVRGLAFISLGVTQRGRASLACAISPALAAGELELVCDCYLEIAKSLAATGDDRSAREELEQAIAVATGGAGWSNARAPKRLWHVGYQLAKLERERGQSANARRIASEALALARRRGSKHGQARLAALLAEICESEGDFGGALRYRSNAIKILSALGDRRSTAELLLSSTRFGSESATLGHTLAAEIGWNPPKQQEE